MTHLTPNIAIPSWLTPLVASVLVAAYVGYCLVKGQIPMRFGTLTRAKHPTWYWVFLGVVAALWCVELPSIIADIGK